MWENMVVGYSDENNKEIYVLLEGFDGGHHKLL
jgi:hypothetical protein